MRFTCEHRDEAVRSTIMGASRDTLRKRHSVIQEIRAYFQERDFLELQGPCLVRGTCPDPFIESFRVGDHYLTTSTEYHIKRLIAMGIPRVCTLQSNFRLGDVGERHNPEFTMLEWGRAGATLREIESDLEAIVARAALVLGRQAVGPMLDAGGPFERWTVADALRAKLNIDLDRFDARAMLTATQALDINVPATCVDDATALFSLLIDELQRHLGQERPTWLVEWPAYLGSSVATGEQGTVERSELFIQGIEISDGFPFVTNVQAQRARFERANEVRRGNGTTAVELDERYLRELPQLPRGAGMAVGVDRLVMALLGVRSIADVIAFPWDEL
jgi:lysyl-tRNA synthetase class 2